MTSVSFIIILIWILASVLLAIYGFIERQEIFSKNQCNSTYSIKDKYKVQTNSSIPGFKLIKFVTSINEYGQRGSKSTLNKQPVLFIPGHLGDVDQVRSLASFSRNSEQYFQYFSLDFGNNSMSAFHGKEIIDQAIFVNDALNSIKQLYEKEKNETFVKIILIGHSLGGIVSRLALLVSNHPSDCIVSDIVMLSSPNVRPPYSPDVSLSKIFHAVNDAWKASLSYSTSECAFAAKRQYVPEIHLRPCSECIKRTKLVSISGGALDGQVLPDTTTLFHLTPAPKPILINADTNKAFSITSFLFSITSVPFKLLFSYKSKIPNLNSTVNSNETSQVLNEIELQSSENKELAPNNELAVSESQSSNSALDSSLSEVNDTDNNSFENSNPPSESIESKSIKLLNETIPILYEAPITKINHISIRTSMLSEVGFSVDHAAMLWCGQFLNSLSKSIELLSKLSDGTSDLLLSTSKDVVWNEVFNFVGDAQNVSFNLHNNGTYEEFSKGQRMLINLWNKYDRLENEFIFKQLLSPLRFISTVAINIVTNHIWKVFPCYIAIAAIVVVSPVLKLIAGLPDSAEIPSGKPSVNVIPVFKALIIQSNPFYHLNIELVSKVVKRLLSTSSNDYKEILLVTVVIGVISAGIVKLTSPDAFFGDVIVILSSVLSWVIAYGVAVFARMIFACVIGFVRLLLGWMVILPGISSLTSKYSKSNDIISVSDPRVVLFVTITLIFGMFSRMAQRQYNRASIPLFLNLATIILLSVFFSLAVNVLLLVIKSWRPAASSSYRPIDLLNFAMLYMIALVSVYPVVLFSLKSIHMIRDPAIVKGVAVGIYNEYFSYGIFSQALSISVVWFHTIMLLNDKSFIDEKIVPIKFLATIFQPINERSSAAKKVSSCVHEEGGKKAIYEKCEELSLYKEIVKGVVIGPTYRVFKCSCANDKSLKHYVEWCEWCRCPKCGMVESAEQVFSRDLRLLVLEILRFIGVALPVPLYAIFLGTEALHPYLNLIAIVSVSCILRQSAEPILAFIDQV